MDLKVSRFICLGTAIVLLSADLRYHTMFLPFGNFGTLREINTLQKKEIEDLLILEACLREIQERNLHNLAIVEAHGPRLAPANNGDTASADEIDQGSPRTLKEEQHLKVD